MGEIIAICPGLSNCISIVSALLRQGLKTSSPQNFNCKFVEMKNGILITIFFSCCGMLLLFNCNVYDILR